MPVLVCSSFLLFAPEITPYYYLLLSREKENSKHGTAGIRDPSSAQKDFQNLFQRRRRSGVVRSGLLTSTQP